MADFTSSGWSLYIMAATALGLALCLWLTITLSRRHPPGEQVGTTGHTWDETLEELNNPLPRWWIYLFYLTIAFAVVYLALYPGFGANQGRFGWSQVSQYETEVARANAALNAGCDMVLVCNDPRAEDTVLEGLERRSVWPALARRLERMRGRAISAAALNANAAYLAASESLAHVRAT